MTPRTASKRVYATGLFTFFRPGDPARRAEIVDCLTHNAASPDFSRFLIYCDEPAAIPEFDGKDKAEIISLGRRFLYRDYFEQATDPDTVYVVSNADIKMAGGMAYCDYIQPKELWALTRWEDHTGPRHPGRSTQDTWIVRGQTWDAEILRLAEISIGLPGCENALAGRWKEAGFKVSNYCRDIKTLHVHASQARGYSEKDRLPRPYYYPDPKRLPLSIRLKHLLRRLNVEK